MTAKRWIKLMEFGANIWGCHQIPERSFTYKSYQFPVCARCTGLMFGYLIAFVMLVCGCSVPLRISVIFLLAMLIDGGLQYLKLLQSNNIRRVITGFLAGIGFINIIISMAKYFISMI